MRFRSSTESCAFSQTTSAPQLQGDNKAATRVSDDTTSWGLRLAKGACLALLASPFSAGARPLAPQRSGSLPLGGARNLLDKCQVGPWSPPTKGLWSPYSTVSHDVRRVLTDEVWVQSRSASCAPGGVETQVAHALTYTFDSTRFPAQRKAAAMAADARQKVVGDLHYLSSYFNLNFTEINETDANPSANLLFFDYAERLSGEAPWLASGPGDFAGNASAVVARTDKSVVAPSQRLEAIGHSLGLSGQMGAGFQGMTERPDTFSTNSFSSLAFPQQSACSLAGDNYATLGALDLAAMAAKYGLSELRSGNRTISLTSYGVHGEGIIFSGESNNTLAINSVVRTPVQLSLWDDGLYPSIVGDSVYLVAPGSKIANGDISGTYGGRIEGNNQTNTLIGSPSDDKFFCGSGSTVVKTGGGRDAVAARYPDAYITILDFTAGQTVHLPPNTPIPPGISGEPASPLPGVLVRLPLNITFYFPTLSAFAPATLNASWPDGSTTGPCVYLAPTPTPSPTPPPARSTPTTFDPCDAINTPGYGGAAATCGASIGVDLNPPIVP